MCNSTGDGASSLRVNFCCNEGFAYGKRQVITVSGPRGTGKTMNLLMLAAENKAAVVCDDPAAMIKRCCSYGLSGLRFYSYEDYINGQTGDQDVVIDEIEQFVSFITKGKAVAITSIGR